MKFAHPPTPEQSLIITAAVETQDNLMIQALAGAAKTSTLVLIAEALPKKEILCLAFNKRIAEEMAERLPTNCKSSTLNSLGHRAWASYLGRRLNLDARKTHRILTTLIAALPGEEKKWAFENLADLMRAVDTGKSSGWIPDSHYSNLAKSLVGNDEFFAGLEDRPDPLFEELVLEASVESLHEAMLGTIDFNDQLLMPTCFPAVFDYTPLVMVDEAQDLSSLNHVMLRKIARKRLIAVGDNLQAIYGFRGAHDRSMQTMKQTFNMKEFGLTISFRCPIAVVEEARWRAPHMQYPAWAKPGHVASLHEWDINSIPTEDVAIICRNNAPLFSMAMRLLRDGRYPELVGNDLGKALIKQLEKLGPPSMKQEDVLLAIAEWQEAKLEKSRNPDRVHDQAECLRIFAREGKTLAKTVEYARRVMEVAGPVKLMTGHKSKGLEFETVFILDRDLIKKDQDQDKNLLYVMQTRSKNTLYYANSANYFSEKDDE